MIRGSGQWPTTAIISAAAPPKRAPLPFPSMESRRHVAERKADSEVVFLDLEVPEAVLEYDRHLVGKAFHQMLWDRNARRSGLEGDVEMVLAGEAAGQLDFAQYPPDHGTQRVLHNLVVGNQAFRRLVGHRLSW